jgi:hypothetical protein
MKLSLILLAALLATACTTTEVQQSYYETEQRVRIAEAEALKAKYSAIASIANTGDTTAKTVALLSLGGFSSAKTNSSAIKAPENPSDAAFKWLSVLAPVGLEAFRTIKSSQVQMHNSDNNLVSTMLSLQSNENTVLGLGRLINPTPVIAPAPIVVRPEVVKQEPVIVQTR